MCDSLMKRASLFLQEPAVRDLVGERVLESVLKIGKQTCFIKKLARLEVSEVNAQSVLWQFRDRLQ